MARRVSSVLLAAALAGEGLAVPRHIVDPITQAVYLDVKQPRQQQAQSAPTPLREGAAAPIVTITAIVCGTLGGATALGGILVQRRAGRQTLLACSTAAPPPERVPDTELDGTRAIGRTWNALFPRDALFPTVAGVILAGIVAKAALGRRARKRTLRLGGEVFYEPGPELEPRQELDMETDSFGLEYDGKAFKKGHGRVEFFRMMTEPSEREDSSKSEYFRRGYTPNQYDIASVDALG